MAKYPATSEVWTTTFGKERGKFHKDISKAGTKWKNSIFVLYRNKTRQIPTDRKVIYGNIVVDYRPQNTYPNRVRITACGNFINYPGELTTRTSDITISKILWNSIISTINVKHMCIDIKIPNSALS